MNELLQKAALLGDTWVIGLLLIASILSVAVMVDRWRAFRANRVDFTEFVATLKQYLEARDIAGALAYCQASPAMEIQITAAGLTEFTRGAHSVAEAMKSALLIARARFEKNLIILATLGNNAPFIGLLGTVLGVIKAFHDLGLQGSSGVSAVMAGISTALIATAFGILLAIPAVIANNYFQTRLKQATQNAQSLIHLLQVYLQAEPRGDFINPVAKNRGVAA
ncbi:MAG: MotA/TolQ/ExbB proton channel family protein [Spirochaetes bacterium]|nr:MotA/TolQ/ExbB proton channel family protein [Spirochaetota bacterium]